MNATLLHRCYNRTGEAATWMPGLECLLWVDIDNGILSFCFNKGMSFT